MARAIELDPLITPRPSTVTLLAPSRVEWIAAAGPVAPHARLSYGVHTAADFRLESTDSLAHGTWQPLPGAPHTQESGSTSRAGPAGSTGCVSSTAERSKPDGGHDPIRSQPRAVDAPRPLRAVEPDRTQQFVAAKSGAHAHRKIVTGHPVEPAH